MRNTVGLLKTKRKLPSTTTILKKTKTNKKTYRPKLTRSIKRDYSQNRSTTTVVNTYNFSTQD